MSARENFEQMEGRFDFDLQIKFHDIKGAGDVSGVHAKQMTIPAGCAIGQHSHKVTHQSSYIGGPVVLKTDEGERVLPFPAGTVEIKAHLHHEIHALGETIWFCIWETNEHDPEKFDEMVKE